MNGIFNVINAQAVGTTPTVILAVNTPPRLSRALQTTSAPRSTLDGDTKTLVAGLLGYIWGRLAGGLGPAWTGPDGGGFSPSDPEELWARTITGMMLGAIYMSAATAYASGSDTTYYDLLEGGGPFPLAVMCQQSSTVALISRGFKHADYSNAGTVGLNAGGSSGRPIWTKNGTNTWLPPSTKPDLDTLAGSIAASPQIGPGAMYEYSLAKPNTGPAHIAYLLRVPRRSANASLDAIQFFDTGGMSGADMAATTARSAAPCVDGIGTYDDPWIVGKVPGPNGGAGHFNGVGVLPPAPNLSATVDMLTKCWPLGFARLILKRNNGKVMYASPLLPMCHTDDATHNFSVAHLLWSLRGLPTCTLSNEEDTSSSMTFGSATWNVFVPRGKVTEQTIKAGRGASLRTIVAGLPAGTGFPAPDQAVQFAAHMLWHLEISVDSSDVLHVKRRMQFTPEAGDTRPAIPGQGGDTLPWGKRSGEAFLATADIQSATPYFVGGEP